MQRSNNLSKPVLLDFKGSETMLLCQTDVAGNNNMFLGLHVIWAIFLSDVNQVPLFLTNTFKKAHISNLTKIHPEEALLIFANRRMDGHDVGGMCFLNYMDI